MTPTFEQAKIAHALNRTATVIGKRALYSCQLDITSAAEYVMANLYSLLMTHETPLVIAKIGRNTLNKL